MRWVSRLNSSNAVGVTSQQQQFTNAVGVTSQQVSRLNTEMRWVSRINTQMRWVSRINTGVTYQHGCHVSTRRINTQAWHLLSLRTSGNKPALLPEA
jgi:hypothetical protein